MLPMHGKTRRGRPPKYQDYWLKLARQKAEERLQTNAAKQLNGEANDRAVKEDAAQQKDTEDEQGRFKNTEKPVPGNCWKADISADQFSSSVPVPVNQRPRSHLWPLQETERDVNRCIPLPPYLQFCRARTEEITDSGGPGLPPIPKKFKQDLPNSEGIKGPTWSDGYLVEVRGYEVPFFMPLAPDQSTHFPADQNFQLRPPEGASEGRIFSFPQPMQKSPRDVSKPDSSYADERVNLNGQSECCALKNWLVDAEKCDHVLDLSNSRNQSLEQSEQNTSLLPPVLLYPPEKPTLRNAVEETGHHPLLRVGPPWNAGPVQAVPQPRNVPSELLKGGGYPLYLPPLGVAFHPFSMRSCSRMAEVSRWTTDQVAHFVSTIPGCREYAECFRQQQIDGLCLFQLSESHLRDVIQMKLGPSLHLKKALDELTGLGANAAA